MAPELSAVLRRPLRPLGWHQQRAGKPFGAGYRRPPQARHQLALPVGGEERRPTELKHVARQAAPSRPGRDTQMQLLQNLVGHHAADLHDSDVPLYRRYGAGRLKRPSFLCHDVRRSIVLVPTN